MKKTFFSLFDGVLGLVNQAISVVVALAVLGFLWGVVKLLFSSDNQIAKKEGKDFMMYGIFTLFVMTSVWGLVNLLSGAITPTEEASSSNGSSADTQSNVDPFTGMSVDGN